MEAPRPFSGPRYDRNSEKAQGAGFEPCALCGKNVPTDSTLTVEVVSGGSRFLLEGEIANESDSGYMGIYSVGPDCARRLRKFGVSVGR